MTHTYDAVYVIGGWYTPDVVAEYKGNQWRLLDNLNQGRRGHGSITVGNQSMIIGGQSENGA